ncbi:hypothetical protein CLV31_12338 [Algoriphagus aquaeductus]|uniref:Uncharacterized protein n=1 Tax=Algoriphagus aquaeductus TaxID=475299 RepID=A0A326RV51_9BACT|nr:hypothetical protein [Algoriphagus aquaeductus]PZV76756.1 hypothetical protein CLV31_12338 [Algoriphagus aquaeductus]
MKRNKVILYALGLLVGIVIYQIFNASLSQPGLEQWEGKYEEIGFYRNENNTGPVVRVFAIRALDENPGWMKGFADAQPHSKYGKTHVFFFSKDLSDKLTLNPKEPFFDPKYREFLLAEYEKTPMGESRFTFSNP